MRLFGKGKGEEVEGEEKTPRQRGQLSRSFTQGAKTGARWLISGRPREPIIHNKHLYGGSPGQSNRLFGVRRDAATVGNRNPNPKPRRKPKKNTYNRDMRKMRKLLWGS